VRKCFMRKLLETKTGGGDITLVGSQGKEGRLS
jgi:hypothetical protein